MMHKPVENVSEKNLLLTPSLAVQHRWPANLVEEDITDFNEERSYHTYDVYLKFFGSVWISPDSVVYKNGILQKETLASDSYKRYYQLRHLGKKIISGKKIKLDNRKKYLCVTDLWSGGHFHWFCDILPRLVCLNDLAREFTLLLPDLPYVRGIGQETLQILRLHFADIAWMREDGFYHAAKLYYLSKLAPSGHMNPQVMKQLREKFVGDGSKINEMKIYISRDKSACRKVVNEEELIDELKDHGFATVIAEDLNLKAQLELFSSCNALLSIHGAGLANCIFMPPGSRVIELRRKENGPHNVGYWHLADSLDHQYYYFNGTPDSDLPLVGKGCNLVIPIKNFEQSVLTGF
jgi:hypothetical protein